MSIIIVLSYSYVKAPYGYMYCLAHSQPQIPREGLNRKEESRI